MRKDKSEAIELRKSGKSYTDIERLLVIPRSTLSEWLSSHRWSEKIKKELIKREKAGHIIRLRRLNDIRGKNLARLYEQARKEAIEEFEQFKFHPLFIAGISVYWGEGDKLSPGLVRIANTDPLMIRLFIQFLELICAVSRNRIKAWLLLYPDLDEKICKSFWIKKGGLSADNFNKSIVIRGRHKTKRVRYGVCSVGVCSTYLKKKIIIWLSLLPKELSKGEYYQSI